MVPPVQFHCFRPPCDSACEAASEEILSNFGWCSCSWHEHSEREHLWQRWTCKQMLWFKTRAVILKETRKPPIPAATRLQRHGLVLFCASGPGCLADWCWWSCEIPDFPEDSTGKCQARGRSESWQNVSYVAQRMLLQQQKKKGIKNVQHLQKG